jgi:hypothetical protein
VVYILCVFSAFLYSKFKYGSRNTMGNPKYPPGTNHLNPNSPLFKPHERGFSRSFLSEISHIFWRQAKHCTEQRFAIVVGRCHVSLRAGLFLVVLFSSHGWYVFPTSFRRLVLIPSHPSCLTIGNLWSIKPQ